MQNPLDTTPTISIDSAHRTATAEFLSGPIRDENGNLTTGAVRVYVDHHTGKGFRASALIITHTASGFHWKPNNQEHNQNFGIYPPVRYSAKGLAEVMGNVLATYRKLYADTDHAAHGQATRLFLILEAAERAVIREDLAL